MIRRPSVGLMGMVLAWGACADDGPQARLAQQAEGARLEALVASDAAVASDATDATATDATATDAATTDAAATDATTTDATDTTVEVDVGPAPCTTASDCPEAPACQRRTCTDHVCGTETDPLALVCDDGDPCTIVDGCVDGTCVGQGTRACLDLDPCTDDVCTAGVGCEHPPRDCDDGDACTADRCVAGFGCVTDDVTCPPTGSPCTEAVCISDIGCTATPRPGHPSCDDQDGCTVGDQCTAGVCGGEPKSCDDNNPCTTDACVDGGCTAIAIAGCVADSQCLGKDPGIACDDHEAGTVGDTCLEGACRGFSATRVPASVIDGAIGMVVKEIDYGPAGWDAVLWTLDDQGDERYALAGVTDPAAPEVDAFSEQSAAFSGLRDGFAADGDGYVWEQSSGGWDYNNLWSESIYDTGLGYATDLWTARDTTANGSPGVRRLWIVGNDGVDEWMRYCREDQGQVRCDSQQLDDFDESSWPTAVWGLPICSGATCQGALLACAADASAGGGTYNDTYENGDGTDGKWGKGAVPGSPSQKQSRALVGWGSSASAQFVAVGTGGYLVHRRANGSWSGPLQLKDGQSARSFSGAWEGAGVVALSATRSAGNGQLELEVWTCPSGKDVEVGSNWTVHSLGLTSNVSVAGLYDLAGRSTGEVRAVGAIRKQGDAGQLLDGVIYVRKP